MQSRWKEWSLIYPKLTPFPNWNSYSRLLREKVIFEMDISCWDPKSPQIRNFRWEDGKNQLINEYLKGEISLHICENSGFIKT